MKKILIILVILLKLRLNLSTNSNACYSIKSTCNEKYKFKCGQKLCAKNISQCRSYVSQRPKHIFKRGVAAFNTCEYEQIKKENYCFNNRICFQNKSVWSLSGLFLRYKVQVKCKCDGIYSFECSFKNNHGYCTLNKNSCDLLQIHEFVNRTMPFIKKCY
jgi:hypothetical protein